MAFCSKCGKELADGAVCSCQSGNVKKSGNNKFALLGIAAAAVVIIIAVVIIATSKPYMKPVNDFMDAVNAKTADQLELGYALCPDFRVKTDKATVSALIKSEDYSDTLENSNKTLEERFEKIDDKFDKWEFSFEMKSKEKLDEDDLEDLQDSCDDYFEDYIEDMLDSYQELVDEDEFSNFADNFGISEKEAKAYVKALVAHYKTFEEVEITDGYEIKGKFVVNADGDEYTTETIKFRVVKINGDWAYAGVVDGSTYIEDIGSYFSFVSNLLSSSYLTR